MNKNFVKYIEFDYITTEFIEYLKDKYDLQNIIFINDLYSKLEFISNYGISFIYYLIPYNDKDNFQKKIINDLNNHFYLHIKQIRKIKIESFINENI